MTDLLLKPEDSGEIPLADGPTRNLGGYALNPPPLHALRLADCAATITGELVLTGHAVEVDDDLQRPGQPRPSGPLPASPPKPKVDDRPETQERGWWGRLRYQGAHRAVGR